MTSLQISIRRNLARSRAVGVVAVVLAGIGFAAAAQARDNVSFSVQFGQPAYAYPVYSQPQVVYVQPQPVYVQQAPVYAQPAPVYYQGPQVIYGAPRPVTYGYPGLYANGRTRGYGYDHDHDHDHDRDHDRGHGWNKRRGGYYVQQAPRYAPDYAPIYYRR